MEVEKVTALSRNVFKNKKMAEKRQKSDSTVKLETLLGILEKKKEEMPYDEFLSQWDNVRNLIESKDQDYVFEESEEEDEEESQMQEIMNNLKQHNTGSSSNEKEFPSTMIKVQGKAKLQWDLIIIVFSVYQAFSVPLDIAFEYDYSNSPTVRTINSIIDLVFIMDIVFRFRTTYID